MPRNCWILVYKHLLVCFRNKQVLESPVLVLESPFLVWHADIGWCSEAMLKLMWKMQSAKASVFRTASLLSWSSAADACHALFWEEGGLLPLETLNPPNHYTPSETLNPPPSSPSLPTWFPPMKCTSTLPMSLTPPLQNS